MKGSCCPRKNDHHEPDQSQNSHAEQVAKMHDEQPRPSYKHINTKKIHENADEFIKTIVKLKPSSTKGTYIKSVFMSSTMSPSIPVDVKDL